MLRHNYIPNIILNRDERTSPKDNVVNKCLRKYSHTFNQSLQFILGLYAISYYLHLLDISGMSDNNLPLEKIVSLVKFILSVSNPIALFEKKNI